MPSSLIDKLRGGWPRRRPEPLLRVLMVCTGNICRSPTAEAVLRRRLGELQLESAVEVDSAGTHAHEGSPPDPRSQRAARARGYEMASLRGRQIVGEDYERFDLILAMDASHLEWMARMAPAATRAERALITERATRFAGAAEVPDPYYGAPQGFDLALDMVEDAVAGWLPWIRDQVALRQRGPVGDAGFPAPKGE